MSFKDLFEELNDLGTEYFYTRGEVGWWLLKHEKRYVGLSNIKAILEVEFPNRNLRNYKAFINELLFIELYESLDRAFENTKNLTHEKREIDLKNIINKIKHSTNGLNREDKNFKWNPSPG